MNEEILKVKVVVDTSAARRPLQQFQRDVKSSSTEVANMDRRFLSMGNTLRSLRNLNLGNLFSSGDFKSYEKSVKSITEALKNAAVGSAATAELLKKNSNVKEVNSMSQAIESLGVAAGGTSIALEKLQNMNVLKGKTLGISHIGVNIAKIPKEAKKAETALYNLQSAWAKQGKLKDFIDLDGIEDKIDGLAATYKGRIKQADMYKEMMVDKFGRSIQGLRALPGGNELFNSLFKEFEQDVDKCLLPLRKLDTQLKKIGKAPKLADKLKVSGDKVKISKGVIENLDKTTKLNLLLDQADGKMAKLLIKIRFMQTEGNKVQKVIASWGMQIAGVALALGEVLFIIKNIKNAIERAQIGDKIKDQSQKALMNYTAYQEWGYVLEQNGVEISVLQTAMKSFGATLAKNDGSLRQYGVTSKNVGTAFGQAITYIQSMESETEKLSAAQALFGKRVANELMPVLNMNKAQTVDLMQTYRLLGGTMSNELIGYSDVLADSMLHLKTAFGGLKNTLAQAFMPVIIKVVQWLTILIAKIRIVLAAIFGFKNTFGGKNPATNKKNNLLGATADNANDAAKNIKNATKEATKLRRYLIGIDELNIMPEKNKASSPGGSDAGAAGGGIDAGDIAGLSDIAGILDDDQLAKLEAFQKKINGIKDILRIATPIFLMAAGALLAVLGFGSANIPLGIAGLGLFGMGIALGKVNGTWEQLFGKIQKSWAKHKGKIVTAIGGVMALLGGVTGNVLMLTAGLGIAALGITVGARNNEWGKLWNNVKSSIDRYSPYITLGIGALLALYGLVICNPALFLVGAGLAGLSIGGIAFGGWSNLFSSLISTIKNFKDKVVKTIKDLKESFIEFFSDSWLGEKLKKFKEFFEGFDLSDVLTNMGNWELFKNIDFDKVKDALSKIAEIAKKIILPDFSGLSALKDLAGNKIASIKIKFSDTKEKLKDKWKDLTGHIKDKTAKFKAKIEAKKEQLKAAWNKVVEGIKGKAVAIGVKIKAAKDVIKQWWSDVKDKLKVGTIELGVKIKDKWEDIKDAWQKNIIDKAQGAKVKIETYIGTKWSDIKDSWQELKKNMDGHKANIKVGIPKWSSYSYTWSKLMNKFKGKTVSMKLKIQATVSNLKSWVNTNLIDKINGKLRDSKLFKSIQIPRLAKGGVLTAPTMALMGEYPGANNNPEIVAPQSILKETVISANGELANVFIQMSRQIVNAIENKEMDVRIGDDAIARSAARGNQNFRLATGKNIF